MKSLDELRDKVTALPVLFASDAEDISPAEGRQGKMDFVNGFSTDYASKESIGEYLQRADFNRLGEIATRELLFRESGGRHTFLSDVSAKSDGYPAYGVLDAYDGEMLTRVESVIERNPVDFTEDGGLANIKKIDCPVHVERQGEPSFNAIAWRTTTRIYGVEENLFSLTLDYSRAIQLSDGSVIPEDSYVVGARDVFLVGNLDNRKFHTKASTPQGDYDEIIPAKGKSGDVEGWWPIVWVDSSGKISIKKAPTVGKVSGTTNYFFAFFAKKGSVFSGEILDIANGGKVNWTAIPIVPEIKTEGEEMP